VSQTDHAATDHTASRASTSFTRQEHLHDSGKLRKHRPLDVAVIGYVCERGTGTARTSAILLEPWPVIVTIRGLLIATVLAFTVPGLLEGEFAVAGLAVGALGTSTFLWQRRAVCQGSRGAQTGSAEYDQGGHHGSTGVKHKSTSTRGGQGVGIESDLGRMPQWSPHRWAFGPVRQAPGINLNRRNRMFCRQRAPSPRSFREAGIPGQCETTV
jgi:hypothetical protein